MEKQLPKNWIIVPLEKLGEDKYYAIGDGDHGQIKPSDYKDLGVPYIRVGDLDWGFFKEDKLVYISEEVHNKNLKSELLPGDILIAKTGATIGKCCIVPNHIKKANTTSSVGKVSINKDLTSSKWILYYFLSPDFFKLMWSHSHRTAQPGFNIIDIKNFPIPLPPLLEQNRIVAKLDALFAQLETIKSSMTNVPFLLKGFRQEVLTQAVTGKLTEEFKYSNILKDIIEDKTRWYDSQLAQSLKNKSKRPRKRVTEFSGDKDYLTEFLVKKIDIAFLDEISAKKENALKAGPFGSSLKKEFYVEKGYKIYGQEQVINDDPFYGNYYVNEEKFKELQSCEVEENDILVSLVGTIGRVLIIPKDFEKGIINPRLVKLSLHEKVNPKYIKLFLQSTIVKDFLKEKSHGGTMDVLNLGIIKSLPIPLPSSEEQQEIVSRVESLFTKADALQKQYESLKAKIDNLPQALLHKAFEGGLTEQLDSDGDARELLKQMQELKKETTKSKKK